MAPNTTEKIVQIADPFDLPVYKLNGSSEEPSAVYYQGNSNSGQQEIDDEDEPSARITTRARITYELDRFSKNVMLVIDTDAGFTMYLLSAFRDFKFEFTFIETAQEEKHEIWRKIDEYFQKDFSNIGIAAVVTSFSDPGLPTVNPVEEWDVLNYYMANQPASLHGRPKIFISETAEPSNLPDITCLPSDTLLIQAKNVAHFTHSRPLDLLCSKLISMKDPRDILDILSEVKSEATQKYTSPVTYISTMTKELMLDKNALGYSDQWTNNAKLMLDICWTYRQYWPQYK